MHPKVTVVIPAYNRADLIHKAINSLKEQTLKEWKAIILDDGSTDHTCEVVQEVVKQDARFSYVQMPENMGICHVLNRALQVVDTPYMVQLDSDDWLEKRALKLLLNTMENEPKTTALAYGNFKWWKTKENRLVRVRGFRTSEKYEMLCYAPSVYPRFYRTECLRDVGGWHTDDKYNGRHMEDRRIMYKLIEKYDFCWVDEHLYNLSRYDTNRLTNLEHVSRYAELKKDMVQRLLDKWGDEYTPIFTGEDQGDGWVKVQLIPNQAKWNKKRTIAHIVKEYLPIMETFVYHQIERNTRFHNVVFTPKITNLEVFPFDDLILAEQAAHLASRLSKHHVDLLHAHFGPSALFALPAKEALGIPMLTFFYGYDVRKYPYLYNKLGEYQKLFAKGELFLVPSLAVKRHLIALGCPKNKIRVAYLGVDTDQIPFMPRSLPDKGTVIRIVSVGRLIEKKGHHILIEALSIVKNKMDRFHLTIIGEGREHQALANQIERLGMEKHVHLAGMLPPAEVKKALYEAHLFCLASLTVKDGDMEGLPVSILEAQASGLPIVSTRHSGIPEGVIEEKSALLAKENNPADLANKLLDMMSQPEKWRDYGSAGREWVERRFNAKRKAEELSGIYFELLGDSIQSH